MNLFVSKLQRFSVSDGDGIRTTVFLSGCNLRCAWCHNPETQEMKQQVLHFAHGDPEICGKSMSVDEVFDVILRDADFYRESGGGVTVSGGEPSYQPDFTLELISLAKEAGVSCAIETCGIGSRSFYQKAAELGTTFLFDIKCINPERHRILTGSDNAHIMSNLHYLMQSGADIIIRLPLIPDCNDSDEDIALLADFLNRNKGNYRYAEIMPYHSLGIGKAEKLGTAVSYNHKNAEEEEMARWCSLFASHGTQVRVSK